MPADFSERLKALRSAMRMSQAEFAHMMRVTRNYVSMLEGGRDPGPKFLEAFDAIERQHYSRAPGSSVVREETQAEDWMARALLAEEELARLRHKLGVFQKLLGSETVAKDALEPTLPPRRDVVYSPPKKPHGARS